MGSCWAEAEGPDRMPPIPSDQWSAEQRLHVKEIISGPRGALYGPFVPLLRSPELMDRTQRLGEYLRYRSAIGRPLTELVILIVAREWTQQVEWRMHEPLARGAGIGDAIIRAIADGRRPVGMSSNQEAVYDFCTELEANRCVSDATYNRAFALLGEKGVVDLAGIEGYYTYLSMIMNSERTAPPAETSVKLLPMPR